MEATKGKQLVEGSENRIVLMTLTIKYLIIKVYVSMQLIGLQISSSE